MRHPSVRIAIVVALFVSQVLDGQQKPSELVGRWRGTLHSPADDIDLMLTISNPHGHYSATLNGEPLRKFRVNGDSFEFEFSANLGDFWKGKATYKGQLSEDRAAITGSVPRTPLQPFGFTRDNMTRSGVAFRVPMMPTAFRGGGENHIVYELHITNRTLDDVTVRQIEVLGDLPPATFSGAALKRLMSKTLIKPDSMAIANMWLTLPPDATVPTKFTHRLMINNKTFDGPDVMVAREPLPLLGPPLKGDRWLALDGPGNSSNHRRASFPDGLTAQRFAIDWFQLWPDGKEVHGSSKDNKNYFSYGTEVFAVADGVVAALKDGIPENTPGPNSRAVPITGETIGGNMIILDIGNSRYAVYAHLQPGSLRVGLGDHVKRGQVLALVGNSGNSTGPHLHFQVVDRNSLLASEGVPYVIDSFEVRGKDKEYQKREKEIPMGGEFIRF